MVWVLLQRFPKLILYITLFFLSSWMLSNLIVNLIENLLTVLWDFDNLTIFYSVTTRQYILEVLSFIHWLTYLLSHSTFCYLRRRYLGTELLHGLINTCNERVFHLSSFWTDYPIVFKHSIKFLIHWTNHALVNFRWSLLFMISKDNLWKIAKSLLINRLF